MRFYNRISNTFEPKTSLEESSLANLSPGSSSDGNWQTHLQSGLSDTELRDLAKKLHEILKAIEAVSLEASDIFSTLSAGDAKYLELNSPLLVKGLSRSKLENVADILLKIAAYTHVR